MSDDPTQAHRRARFKALIEDEPYRGNLSELGRALGYKDGVFVRQMRDGMRPISEKTVKKIESLPSRAGWFGIPGLSPAAIALGSYFDNATPQEKALLARMIPVELGVDELPGKYSGLGGLDTNYGSLDEKPKKKKKS